jgi:hypothetical protein
MTIIKSRYIAFAIPRPYYLDEVLPDAEECSGLIFETNYGGKILYVGLGGGDFNHETRGEYRIAADSDKIIFTPIGNLVCDLLTELPVNAPNFVFANILDENAKNDEFLLSRIEDIFSKADEYSKIMIIGDFSSALDGRVTPLLGVYAVTDVKGLKNQH